MICFLVIKLVCWMFNLTPTYQGKIMLAIPCAFEMIWFDLVGLFHLILFHFIRKRRPICKWWEWL